MNEKIGMSFEDDLGNLKNKAKYSHSVTYNINRKSPWIFFVGGMTTN